MSEVHSLFRRMGGDALDSLSDEDLTLFIGSYFPEFKRHPRFGVEYASVKEGRDTAIIERLQSDIASEGTNLQKPTGQTIKDRILLGMGQGAANIGKSVAATAGALQFGGVYAAPLMNIPAVRRGVESFQGKAREAEIEYGEAGEMLGGGLAGEFSQALGQGATSIVPSVAAAFFGGLPSAMATAGLLQFGDTYDTAFQTYVKQGMPEDLARDAALKPAVLSGVVTAGLTSFGGAERFFSRLARGKIQADSAKAVLGQIAKSSGLEGIEEGIDQALQGFIERASFNPNKPMGDLWRESAMAAAVGMTLGAVIPGFAMGAGKLRRSMSKQQATEQTAPSMGEPTETAPPVIEETQTQPGPRQTTAGQLVTQQGMAVSMQGGPVPINAATINEDGTVTLQIGDASTTFAADDILTVEPMPQTGATAPTAEPGITKPLPEGEIPPEALRAFPESASAMDTLLRKAMPRRPDAPPPMVFDNETPFPDFPEHETSKKIFTQPHGAAYIPALGKVIDPNARHLLPVGESLNTYAAEVGRGQALASAYGAQIQGLWDALFPVNPEGSVTSVKAKRDGPQSLALGDVVESLMRDPQSYETTAEQRELIAEIKSRGDQMRALLKKYGLAPSSVADVENEEGELDIQESDAVADYSNYLPRIVISRPSQKEKAPVAGGGGLGKAFFEKGRIFETEAEGIAAEFEYEPSIERRFVTFVERAYRRIAAKRLLEDPALGGISRQTAEAELRAQLLPIEEQGTLKVDLESGGVSLDKSQKAERPDVEQRIRNALAERTANSRAFFGKVFPPETVKALNDRFRETSRAWRLISRTNNMIKALKLNYDLGAWFHQGLITFYLSPVTWGRASASALQAFFDPGVVGEIARNNVTPLREMAQMGSSFGRLQEFLAGAERGQPLEHPTLGKRLFGKHGKIADAAIGATTRAFARHFTTFLDVAKLELYKSARATLKPEERMEAMRAIESIMLSGRSKSIGVVPSQLHVEQAALLAPAYYRGALNLVALIGQRGIGGQMARRALGSYAFGGLALYAGVALTIGMDWEEIEERLNPLNSEFMNWRVKMPNGNVINFGLGGIMKSFIRTLAQSLEMMATGDWDKMKSGTNNPLVRWYRAHSGPLVSAAWDLFSGKDYMGEKTDVGTVLLRNIMPLNAQSLLAREYERERGAGEIVATSAAETVGMSTHQESFGRTRMRELGEISQSEFKTDYDRLNLSQRGKVLEKFEASPEFQNRAAMSPTLKSKITELESDAQKEMTKLLSEEARKVLDDNGLDLPAFKTGFQAGGRTIVLTDDERERYMELISEEASEAIEAMKLHGSPEQRREQFSEVMTKAKARATAQMKKELPEE